MNKIFVPKITFKNVVADEKRIMTAYGRIFTIARRNILSKRVLTSRLTHKYNGVHEEGSIFNNRGGGRDVAC